MNPTTTTLALGGATAALGAPIQLTATVGSAAATPAMTGSVSFTFVTYAANDGGADESWLLGSTPVTAAATGGTATLTTAIPPGTDGQVDVVAEYSGDPSYLWSQSARTRIAVTGLTLAIAPASATLRPNQYLTMTATGSAQPLLWEITRDSDVRPVAAELRQQRREHLRDGGRADVRVPGGRERRRDRGAREGGGWAGTRPFTVTVAGTPADAGAFSGCGDVPGGGGRRRGGG